MTVSDAIEEAIVRGEKPENIEDSLIRLGWPPPLVRESLDAWLAANGRKYNRLEFKKWLARQHLRATPYIVLVTIFSLLGSATLLLKPWPIKIMVDSVFGNIPAPFFLQPYTGSQELLFFLAIISGLIFILSSVFGAIKDFMLLRFSYKLNIDLKTGALNHLLHLPLYHQDRLSKGDYVYRQNNLTESLASYTLATTSNIAQSLIMIVGIFVILLSINATLALLTLFVVPGLIILTKVFGPGLSSVSQALTKNFSDIASSITESVDNVETVQAYGMQKSRVSKTLQLWASHLKHSTSALIWSRSYKFSNGLVVMMATSGVLYFGGLTVLNGSLSLGELLVFIIYMGYLVGPVEGLVNEYSAKNQKTVDLARVYEVLSDHQDIENLRSDIPLLNTSSEIEFKNVGYSYAGETTLKNINLKIPGGSKIAIIGPSGSGKTTLLKLIPLFVEPTYGRISIDGFDIQAVSLADLRKNIGWISQTPQVFSGSLAENLAGSQEYANPQLITKALKASNVDEFMNKNGLGLNMLISEGGASLSGGQRQRIAIARALVKNAPILLMDEPTSALDDESEKVVKNNIAEFMLGKTVVLVTHKRLLLDLMDKVYVMKDGQLIDVEQFGGVRAYFGDKQVVSEVDVLKQKQILELQQQKLLADQQAILRLREENLQLRDSSKNQTSLPDDGTIYINH